MPANGELSCSTSEAQERAHRKLLKAVAKQVWEDTVSDDIAPRFDRHAGLEENTTWDLVEDIEKLRYLRYAAQ
jgi:hypothetical protein